MNKIKAVLTAVVIFSAPNLLHAAPLGSAFTYQGTLAQNGVDVTDICDFNFGLWDASAGGMAVAVAVDVLNVSVADGRFTVELDFGGGAFNGDARWLEIAVACPAGGGLTTLVPRQELTPSPNALFAAAAGAMEWTGLLSVPPDISDGDDVDDADADPANEIQDLDLSANTLSLSGDASPVDLSGYLDNTDAQTLANVLAQGNDAGGASISNIGTTTTNSLIISSLDCTGNLNGGALTTDGAAVYCSDDDAGAAGNTLDQAYDQGGAGAGRTITADSGAVTIDGADGLTLDSGSLLQSPGDPVQLGSFGIGSSPDSVYVSGRYAYVVDGGSMDLKVIDVSNPSGPSQVGSVAGLGFPGTIHVSGRYAYVSDSNWLRVVDVSDPSAPVVVGNLNLGGLPGHLAVSGRYAYSVDSMSDELKVIDVADPGAPSLAGSVSIGAFPNSIGVLGRYAYVTDFTDADLKVIDVANPAAPSVVGTLMVGGSPRGMDVSGRYAYIADNTSQNLIIVDVSDPAIPALAGSITLGAPSQVYVSGRYAYVTNLFSNDLDVIDVSNPAMPVLTGTLDVGGDVSSLQVSGRHAYLVGPDFDALKVIDITGAEVTSLTAHALEAGSLQVRNDIIAQGQLQVTSGINVGSGGIFSDGNVGVSGTIAIANDIAPTVSPANLVQLFAEDVAASSELRVRNEAGTVTTLSPHNFSLIGEPSEPMAWSHYSENDQWKINVDMLRTVRLVERMSGEKLVYTEMREPGEASGDRDSDLDDAGKKLLDQKEVARLIEQLMVENQALKRRMAALEARLE